jgi:hypothetical protein
MSRAKWIGNKHVLIDCNSLRYSRVPVDGLPNRVPVCSQVVEWGGDWGSRHDNWVLEANRTKLGPAQPVGGMAVVSVQEPKRERFVIII